MKYQAPRGTYDIYPPEVDRWRAIETVFRELVELYGYGEVRTPMFEDTEVFVRSSGETSEVVTKQMYSFEDKGGRNISLKPEVTAPAIRAYLEHKMGGTGAVTRLWYCSPIFRYERPQKGRCRQAHQVGLELIGSPSVQADAEVIEITVKFYERIGLSGVRVMLNSIGREATRSKYKMALISFVEPWLKTQDSDMIAKAEKNPLRLLDSKDPELVSMLESAPNIQDFLEDESKARFDALQELLTEADVAFQVSPRIVRGLDYYTDTVFEVQSASIGAQDSLCGGGRYDNLIREMGGPDTPSVGVAMGLERAILAQQAASVEAPTMPTDAYLIAATGAGRTEVRALARRLRVAGYSVVYDLDDRSLKSQFRQADAAGARFAIVIGDSEIESGTVTVKNMQTSDQTSVSISEVSAALKRV